jgi:iron complex outermembrane receptor protein
VHLVLGGEWRHDGADFVETAQHIDVGRDIASVFSEVRLPLLDSLSLKIAVRGDDFGNGEDIVNPQYGLTWRPAKDWLFRAAYGTSFRPPSLYEMYMPLLQPSLLIADPRRDGEVSSVPVTVGGNPDLEVVTARSLTAGIVFSPAEYPGLRLGASYWRVVMDNRILTPIYQELLKPDSPLSGLVSRYDPGEGETVGRLRSINLTRVNYGDLETSGIDLDASIKLERDYGCFRLDLAATWVDKYLTRDMNQALPLDRVGIANVQGTIPKWRAVGTLSWKLGEVGASTTATFVPPYRDADLVLGLLNRRVDRQFLIDLQGWVDVNWDGNSLLDESKITLGARNLFNEGPDFANAGASFGYDVSQSELTRRYVYFRISKQFN